jgi:hypothetical protein
MWPYSALLRWRDGSIHNAPKLVANGRYHVRHLAVVGVDEM